MTDNDKAKEYIRQLTRIRNIPGMHFYNGDHVKKAFLAGIEYERSKYQESEPETQTYSKDITMLDSYQAAFNHYFNSGDCARDLQAVVEKIRTHCDYGRLFFIGNGGSACISAHMAEDFDKLANIPSLCMSNVGLVTCLANDEGYENIFRIWLGSHYCLDDLLIAISSSGKSQNIIKGAQVVGKNNLITLTGFDDNPLSKMGCINVHVPYNHYGIVESLHATFLHLVLDTLIEKNSKKK